MGRVERVTPRALLDLYELLPDEDQCDFLRLLGKEVVAEAPFLLASSLDHSELMRFAEMVTCSPTVAPFFLIMEREAIRFARANLNRSESELEATFGNHMKQFMETWHREIGAAEAERLKQDRDRASDPDTIRRNVEICDMRKRDSKTWTQGKLAKRFGMTPQNVRKILKSEAEWRQKAARLSTN